MTDHAVLTTVSTGDLALDAILGGGIPTGSMTIVAGEPGTGKTILALQMLFAAAHKGQKCLYFTTLSEPAIKVIRYMQQFDFFDVDLIDKQVIFIDLGASLHQGADHALTEIGLQLEKHEPALIAIDSYRAIGDLLRSSTSARSFAYNLSVQLITAGATTLLIGEYTRNEVHTMTELAVADGILELTTRRAELTATREIEIVKLRGAAFVTGRHFYDITSRGLVFYPRVRSGDGAGPPLSGRRESTGVAGLDEMFGGGIPEGSATIFQGGTGTGKTLLGLQLLIEGARQGKRGVYFTLEETLEQLRAAARNVGSDLEAYERDGLISIEYFSPVELSTDRYLDYARRWMGDPRVTRVVLDSLSTLALGVTSERRFKELAYTLAKHAREHRITFAMTLETEQLLGSAQLSAHGVSFIADNLIQLRYVEVKGRLTRGISILKARGVHHDTGVRAFVVSSNGLEVRAQDFENLRGVITGLPVADS